MSKDVAVIAASGKVVNISVQHNDYELQPYEVPVSGVAWIGGDYIGGYFYPPQPYASWTRNEGEWLPTVAMPTDAKHYVWDEEFQNWQTSIEP